jgi:hypothetical protein
MIEENHVPASEILRRLAAGEEQSISIGSVVSAAGSRVHGLALLLLALPDALPLPIPSVSAIIGVPLLLISAHLAIFGDNSRLPQKVEASHIPRAALAGVARYLVPFLSRLEQISEPRWRPLIQRERLIGIVCVYLSLILLLPIPFMNTPPAMCLAAIGLGMIQRDGLLVAGGFVGTALTTAALVGAVNVAGSLLDRL